MDSNNNERNHFNVEIALLKQRVESVEGDVRSLDSDIRSLRAEIKHSFEKVFERFDVMRDEMQSAKQFGRGVYWVVGTLAALALAFKDQIIAIITR